MHRFVYAFTTTGAARAALASLRKKGFPDSALSIIARSDIEMEKIPEAMLDTSNDFVPAVGRGAAVGAIAGVLAGIALMVIPPLGITVGGTALAGFFYRWRANRRMVFRNGRRVCVE